MNKRYTLLLSFVLTLFVLLFLMLCRYSRLATDDYYFIWDVRNHGIISNVYSQYMEWCGRFAANFLMDLVYKLLDVNQTYYFLFPLLSFAFLIGGIYRLITTTADDLGYIINTSQKWIVTLSFTALLFFLSVDIGETWFWYCGLSSYLWSITAFVWGISFLFYNRNQIISYLGIIVCFIYVGGSSEVYSVIYGLILLLFIIYNWRKSISLKVFVSSEINKKLIVLYAIFGISFIIFLIAPGNYLRDGLFPKHQLFYSFYITAKSIVKFGALYLPFKVPFIIAFSSSFLIIGESIRSINASVFSVSFKTLFYCITILFCSLLFIFFFLVAYVMVETGPPRLWFLISFLLSVYCSIVCFYAGYTGILNAKKIIIIKNVSVILGIGLMLFFIVKEYSIVSKYSKANDERIEQLVSLNHSLQKDTIIKLTPLPPSGMLYSTEIASDTSHFTNKEIRLGYELKYHVVVNR
jgi:hypothetical protein